MVTVNVLVLQFVRLVLIAGFVIAAGSAPAKADIAPIGPFVGDLSDSFNRFSSTNAVQTLDVFRNRATLSNLTDDGAIKIEFSSQFNGDLVTPRSGMMVGQLGVGRWDFDTPAVQFGGYFENNSGASDATLFFYDANLALIGSVIANVPVSPRGWNWNGWQSDVAFSRIEVVGNGLIQGFIWYEDMQLTTIPEPGSGTLLLTAFAVAACRRR